MLYCFSTICKFHWKSEAVFLLVPAAAGLAAEKPGGACGETACRSPQIPHRYSGLNSAGLCKLTMLTEGAAIVCTPAEMNLSGGLSL